MKYPKNTFHKLYLIEKEMYDRILPQLNAVDKEEIVDLNAEHAPEYTANEEPALNEDDDATEENSSVASPTEANPVTIESNQIPVEAVPKESKKIKIKKFACDVCTDKRFTTKYSLNRHKNNFHSLKQTVSKPEDQEGPPPVPIQKFKRKREEEEEAAADYPVKKARLTGRPGQNPMPIRAVKRKAVGKDLRPSKKFRWENFS